MNQTLRTALKSKLISVLGSGPSTTPLVELYLGGWATRELPPQLSAAQAAEWIVDRLLERTAPDLMIRCIHLLDDDSEQAKLLLGWADQLQADPRLWGPTVRPDETSEGVDQQRGERRTDNSSAQEENLSTLEIHQRAVDTYRRKLGDEHPDTLVSMNNLALVHMDLGNLEEARELYEQVLDVRHRVLGDEHPQTIASIYNLELALRDLGHAEGAQELLEQGLDVSRRVLGDEHPQTIHFVEGLRATLETQTGQIESSTTPSPILNWLRNRFGLLRTSPTSTGESLDGNSSAEQLPSISTRAPAESQDSSEIEDGHDEKSAPTWIRWIKIGTITAALGGLLNVLVNSGAFVGFFQHRPVFTLENPHIPINGDLLVKPDNRDARKREEILIAKINDLEHPRGKLEDREEISWRVSTENWFSTPLEPGPHTVSFRFANERYEDQELTFEVVTLKVSESISVMDSTLEVQGLVEASSKAQQVKMEVFFPDSPLQQVLVAETKKVTRNLDSHPTSEYVVELTLPGLPEYTQNSPEYSKNFFFMRVTDDAGNKVQRAEPYSKLVAPGTSSIEYSRQFVDAIHITPIEQGVSKPMKLKLRLAFNAQKVKVLENGEPAVQLQVKAQTGGNLINWDSPFHQMPGGEMVISELYRDGSLLSTTMGARHFDLQGTRSSTYQVQIPGGDRTYVSPTVSAEKQTGCVELNVPLDTGYIAAAGQEDSSGNLVFWDSRREKTFFLSLQGEIGTKETYAAPSGHQLIFSKDLAHSITFSRSPKDGFLRPTLISLYVGSDEEIARHKEVASGELGILVIHDFTVLRNDIVFVGLVRKDEEIFRGYFTFPIQDPSKVTEIRLTEISKSILLADVYPLVSSTKDSTAFPNAGTVAFLPLTPGELPILYLYIKDLGRVFQSDEPIFEIRAPVVNMSQSFESMMSDLAEETLPVGIWQRGKFLYLAIQWSESGSRSKRWSIRKLQIRRSLSGIAVDLVGQVDLPVDPRRLQTHHLRLVPGDEHWFAIAEDISTNFDQPNMFVYQIPAGWIEQPSGSPIASQTNKPVECQPQS